MIMRCFPSVLPTLDEGALCQVGLALRSDPDDCIGAAAAPGRSEDANSGGVSLT